MTNGKLKINSENIMPIIKKWLYSDKDIFLRELVSNATDATTKLTVLADKGEALHFPKEDLIITVSLDKENKRLTVSDHGLGMTADEVEKYITDVAFSGAAEFVEKYQKNEENGGIIGHFGLGFYSAFMVSEKVEIRTKSHKEGAQAVLWSCDGSSSYTIENTEREKVGTDIILHLNDDEMLDEEKLTGILQKYCQFLPHPIYFGETRINDQEPLWMKNPLECTDDEYRAFYQSLYPNEEPPIFWVHLNVDHPFHLQGILYFPKINPRFDFQSASIKLFSKRVFVSDNLKDLFPDYLTVLRGAIDSPDIPLNVSRSYLQMNSTVQKLSLHIAKKLGDRLKTFAASDREHFLNVWGDMETIVKLGALREEKFYDKVKEILMYKTIKGEFLTAAEYLALYKDAYESKIYYTTADEDTTFLSMYKEKGIEVLKGGGPLDSALFNTLESKLQCKFQRIDGGISDLILDQSENHNAEDHNDLTNFVKESLGLEHVSIEAKGLSSRELPGFVMIDEGFRRMRDYFAMSQKQLPTDAFSKHTFVLNTNNSLIESLGKLKQSSPELSKKLVQQIYDLSLLSQKEMHPDSLGEFIKRTGAVLEELAVAASKE